MSKREKEERFYKRLKVLTVLFGLLSLMNIIILIGRNSSYALFRRTVSSKRVIEIHTAKEFPSKDLLSDFKAQITSHTTDGANLTVEDEDGTIYLSGTNDQINFNYVWYSGKLWRITAINPDNTIKMITQDAITAIHWNNNTTYSEAAWIYQWLNEDFLDTLYNQENIIVQNGKWYATLDSNTIPVKPTGSTIDGNVGLLNAYEYYQSYKNLGAVDNSTAYGSGYLNIGYVWWLITPYNSSSIRYIDNNGNFSKNSISSYNAYGVRPSVNLKSDIKISGGNGTKENPYRIEGDKSVAKVNDKLNSRVSGEYVNFDGKKYRIVGIENGTTKLTSVDYIRDDSGAVILQGMEEDYWPKSVTSNYGCGRYLNNTWYNSINETYKKMLSEGTYYLGNVGHYESNESYKKTICNAGYTTDTTKECAKTSIWKGYVGLPRMGEMFSAMLGNGYTDTTVYIWLITSAISGYDWIINNNGILAYSRANGNGYGVRPSIVLKPSIVITDGEGTEQSPYEIKYFVQPAVNALKDTMGQNRGIIGVTTTNQKTTEGLESNIREYRYSGTEVDNYVTFNNEKWRIIGIFKDEDGQEHVKIVRNEELKNSYMPLTYEASDKTFKIKYNSTYNSAYWDNDGIAYDNNWADAGLMNWLNSKGTTGGYLNSLTSTAQLMIEETKWYLGTVTFLYQHDINDTVSESYKYERAVTGCSENKGPSENSRQSSVEENSTCRVWANNAATWPGKIGLMYPSDYGFSTESTAWELSIGSSSSFATSWLYKTVNHSEDEWLLSPASASSSNVASWEISGNISVRNVSSASNVRPVLYLKSDVKIIGGDGTSSDSYQLSLN